MSFQSMFSNSPMNRKAPAPQDPKKGPLNPLPAKETPSTGNGKASAPQDPKKEPLNPLPVKETPSTGTGKASAPQDPKKEPLNPLPAKETPSTGDGKTSVPQDPKKGPLNPLPATETPSTGDGKASAPQDPKKGPLNPLPAKDTPSTGDGKASAPQDPKKGPLNPLPAKETPSTGDGKASAPQDPKKGPLNPLPSKETPSTGDGKASAPQHPKKGPLNPLPAKDTPSTGDGKASAPQDPKKGPLNPLPAKETPSTGDGSASAPQGPKKGPLNPLPAKETPSTGDGKASAPHDPKKGPLNPLKSEDQAMGFPLIDENGNFQSASLDKFVTANELPQSGPPYAVVTTMGPVGSGKSTLFNCLFETSFPPMDASSGRNKTTRGVWLARAKKVEPSNLLVMDLEGTDGIEQKGDTAFEWQTALLALALSDFVLINMWCCDIGRENGASVPLLKMVFQAFMTQFKSLKKNKMKTTLLIVIRDKLKSTPEKKLETQLNEEFHQIWESVRGSSSDELKDFFDVKVEYFPHYEHLRNDFDKQVDVLREKFKTWMAAKGRDKVSYRAYVLRTGLSKTVYTIWKAIKENERRDLLTPQETISNTYPTEIFKKISTEYKEQWEDFKKKWKQISKSAEHHDAIVSVDEVKALLQEVIMFVDEVNALLNKQTESFNKELLESSDFDENTKTYSKEVYKVLAEQEAREIVLPIYEDLLSKRCDVAFQTFKNKSTSWAPSSNSEDFAIAVRQYKRDVLKDFEVYLTAARIEFIDYESEELKQREKILRQIDDEVSSVRDEKTGGLITSAEAEISKSNLAGFTKKAYESATDDTWITVQGRLEEVVQSVWSSLRISLAGYGLDDAIQTSELRLQTYGRKIVTDNARVQANSKASGRAQALQQMTKRFDTIFKPTKESTEQRDHIQTVVEVEVLAERAQRGRSAALKVLSVLAVVRLDDKADDVVEQTLSSLLLGERERISTTQLTATEWAGIPSEQTLLNPKKCVDFWNTFYRESEDKVKEAIRARRQNQRKTNTGEGTSDNNKDTNSQQSPDSVLEEEAKKNWKRFKSEEEWVEISNVAKVGSLDGFGSRVNGLLTKQIVSFVKQSSYKDDKTRTSYRVILEMEAGKIVLDINEQTLSRHYDTAIKTFDSDLKRSETLKVTSPLALRQLKRKALETFDKGVTDTRVDYTDNEKKELERREKLSRDIDVRVSSARKGNTRDVVFSQKVEMKSDLGVFTRTTLKSATDLHNSVEFTWKSLKFATDETWSKVRLRLKEVVESAKSSLLSGLTAYLLDETTQKSYVEEELDTYGRVIVREEAERQASDAVQCMTERFETIFGTFSPDVTIQQIADKEIQARFSALKVLSVLAVIRLNEETSDAYGRASDPVDKILVALLFRGRELTARSWQGIPREQTLLSPLDCSKIWIEFLFQTYGIVEEALANLQGESNLTLLPRPSHDLQSPGDNTKLGKLTEQKGEKTSNEEGLPQNDKLSSSNSNGAQNNEIPAAVQPEKEESQHENTPDLNGMASSFLFGGRFGSAYEAPSTTLTTTTDLDLAASIQEEKGAPRKKLVTVETRGTQQIWVTEGDELPQEYKHSHILSEELME